MSRFTEHRVRSIRRVPREEVIRTWLAREHEKSGEEPPQGLSIREAFDALLTENPGAAAFLWRDAPLSCYRVTLSRARFDRLHVIEGPAELGWGAFSPDGTIAGCARRIVGADPDQLARERGIDVGAIERLARDHPGLSAPLVLSTRRGAVPWHVADGNHRAVATAIALRRGGRYEPIPAYLCVGANPVLEPLVQRILGLIRGIRSPWDISKTQ